MTELYVPLSFEKKLLRYQTPSFSLTIDTIFCHIVPLTPGGHDKRCPLIFLGYPMIQFHEPKKKGMVYHSYPMILPFLISLFCSMMIPYSEVFITWFHGKILRFYDKSQLFHVQLEKKTLFHFSMDFSPLFLWCLGWSSPTQKTMAWKRACQPRGRPRGKRGRSALANGVFRGGHPKGDNTLNHSYIYIML